MINEFPAELTETCTWEKQEKSKRWPKRLKNLRRLRESMNALPQTVAREFDAARLDAEIAILESEVRLATAKRVVLFLDSWRKTGRFTAIRGDGAQMDANPVITGAPVQDFWNVKGEAYRLANWSFGIESPWWL